MSLILIIIISLIIDYNNTKKEKLKKQEETQNYKNNLPKQLKENIPDKDNIAFIDLVINANKDIFPLLKQEKFRKSLYYALNRKEITQNKNNLKPISVLFTKAFFTDNKNCFPKTFLPQNEESMKIYEDLDLKNYGFNEYKALKCLEESWESMNSEEQKKNYVLRFKTNKNISTLEKIVKQINDLFQKFLEKKKLDPNKLKIETTYEKDFDMRLNILYPMDEYKKKYNNKEYYYLYLITTFNFKNDSKISIDLSHIKKYLENKKNQDEIVDVSFQNFFKNKELVDSQGIFKGDIYVFYDFMEENIFRLFPFFKEEYQSQQKESKEIQDLRQKTFEEIFEKVLCLLHEEMLQIPVFTYNEENEN